MSGTVTIAQTPTSAMGATPGAGPFRLGMNLDEVKAAAPQLSWRDGMVSKHTGRVFSIRSANDLTIAGVDFEVGALAHYYQHGLRLTGAARAEDAATCEQAGIGVLAAIEPRAGPFTSRPPRVTPPTAPALQWNTQRSANGSISVVPSMSVGGAGGRSEGETVRFGTSSTALVEAFDGQYRSRSRRSLLGPGPAFLRLAAFNGGADWRVDANVEYDAGAEPSCTVRIEFESRTQPPVPQTFDTSSARVIDPLSVAERHLVQEPELPGGEVIDVELRCDIDRVVGWTFNCGVTAPDGITDAQAEVAQRLARLLAFDTQGVDRDDPQMMRGTVRVRVDPADRQPIDFLAATRTPMSDVVFDAQPAVEPATETWLPEPAHTAWIDVRLTCRIQSDGSLVCAAADAADDAERPALVSAARRLAGTEYRAAPLLRGGAPSAGSVIDLTVRVRLQF